MSTRGQSGLIGRLTTSVYVAILVALALVGLVFPALAEPPGGGGGHQGPPADPAIVVVRHGVWEELVVMNSDGTNAATIYRTRTTYIDSGPSWSPDGASIAFPMSGDLYHIDVQIVDGVPTGTNLTMLVGGADNSTWYPAWSPLGDEILFVDIYGDARLEVVPASGGPTQTLYQSPPGHQPWWPAWSPDGVFIAFVEFDDIAGAYQIRILERSTGTLVETLPPTFSERPRFLDWGRTADVLLYDHQNQGWIHTLDISSGVITPIVSGQFPTWSPDDSQIAFSGRNARITVRSLATGDTQEFRTTGWWADWRRF